MSANSVAKRPKKKEYTEEGHSESKGTYPLSSFYEDKGYNQACDEWSEYTKQLEAYHKYIISLRKSYEELRKANLPSVKNATLSEEEIEKIIHSFRRDMGNGFTYIETNKLAKAIHKRITG